MAPAPNIDSVPLVRTFIFVWIIVVLAGCPQAPDKVAPSVSLGPGASLTVRTAPAAMIAVGTRSRFKGTVRPWQATALSAEAAGKVERRRVDNGQRVKPGDVLFELDGSRQRLAVRGAEAQKNTLDVDARWLRSELVRKEQLLAKKAIAPLELDAARYQLQKVEAGLAQAEVQLDTARRALWDTKVRAPHGGEITARAVDVGDQVAPGRVLAVLVDLSRVRVVAAVRGHEAGAIKAGQRASVFVADVGVRRAGVVSSVAPVADSRSGLFDVELVVDNADLAIAAGLSAQVDFAPGDVTQAVLSVPADAVMLDGQQALVFVIEGQVAHRRDVVVGVSGGDRVEIRDGLTVGEQVAVSDLFALSDGAKVSAEPLNARASEPVVPQGPAVP